MTKTDNPDVILTADTVAQMLGLHRHTLMRMRAQPDAGGLPFVAISPRRLGYRLGDVQAYLAARRVGRLPSTTAVAA